MRTVAEDRGFASSAVKPIELDWYAADEVVRVTPRDQDRFEVHKDRAIDVLRAEAKRDKASKQIDLLIQRIGSWAMPIKTQWEDVILTAQDQSLLLIVIHSSANYDWNLSSELSRLDLDVAGSADFEAIRLNTLLLPSAGPDALGAFIDPGVFFSYAKHFAASSGRE